MTGRYLVGTNFYRSYGTMPLSFLEVSLPLVSVDILDEVESATPEAPPPFLVPKLVELLSFSDEEPCPLHAAASIVKLSSITIDNKCVDFFIVLYWCFCLI
jgi:hypothetical protein